MTHVLSPKDGAPIEVVNPEGSGAFVVICDHASNRIPQRLNHLGLDHQALGQHIALDIGTGPLSREIGRRFDSPVFLARFSRLVVDLNRALDDPELIVARSDGIPIPGNQRLCAQDRAARIEEIYHPYHHEIAAHINPRFKRDERPIVLFIHSFTPKMATQDAHRPWQVGVIWKQNPELAQPMIDILRRRGDLVVGDNEPYDIRKVLAHSIASHAEVHGLPHLAFEVRQDELSTHEGVMRWADILESALRELLRQQGRESGIA